MSDFLLHRDTRKRKRAIYARAHKALGDLQEALRDMREFSGQIKPLYERLEGDGVSEVQMLSLLQRRLKTLEIVNNGMSIHDILSTFNNTREEISSEEEVPCEA